MNLIRIKVMICFVLFSGLSPRILLFLLAIIQGTYVGQLIGFSKFKSFLLNSSELIIEGSTLFSFAFITAVYESSGWKNCTVFVNRIVNSFEPILFVWSILGGIIIAIAIQTLNLFWSLYKYTWNNTPKMNSKNISGKGFKIIEIPKMFDPPEKRRLQTWPSFQSDLTAKKVDKIFYRLVPVLNPKFHPKGIEDDSSYIKMIEEKRSQKTSEIPVYSKQTQPPVNLAPHNPSLPIGENQFFIQVPSEVIKSKMPITIKIGKTKKFIKKTIIRNRSVPRHKKKKEKELKKLRENIRKQEKGYQTEVSYNGKKTVRSRSRKRRGKKRKSISKIKKKKRETPRRRMDSGQRNINRQSTFHSARKRSTSPESAQQNEEGKDIQEKQYEEEKVYPQQHEEEKVYSHFQPDVEMFQGEPSNKSNRDDSQDRNENYRRRIRNVDKKIDLAKLKSSEKDDALKAFNEAAGSKSPNPKFRVNAFKKKDLKNRSVDPQARNMMYQAFQNKDKLFKEETKDDLYNSDSSENFKSKTTFPKYRSLTGRNLEGKVLKAAGKSVMNNDLSVYSGEESKKNYERKNTFIENSNLFEAKKHSDDNSYNQY